LGDTILMVDPFLTRPKMTRVYSGRVSPDSLAINAYIKRCDHILVSHTHFDHFMDAPEITTRTSAIIHGSVNSCELARKLGVSESQTHRINAGNEFSIGDIRIKVIAAAHPWITGYTRGRLKKALKMPPRLRDYRMDFCLSFLITFQGKRILVWSSKRVDDAEPADVIICRAVSGRRWYAEMMESVQLRLVIPDHWDDMFPPLSEPPMPFFSPLCLALPPIKRIDLREFEGKIRKAKPGCKVLVPERFKEYLF